MGPRQRRAVVVVCLALLGGCSGDRTTFKTPPESNAPLLVSGGLEPAAPQRLEPITAWLLTENVLTASVFVGTSTGKAAEFVEHPMTRQEEQEQGFVRWEAELGPRPEAGELIYYFSGLGQEQQAALLPEGGPDDPIAVAEQPIEIDFPWPAWPEPATALTCNVEFTFDCGAPAGNFDEIRDPQWVPPGQASILGNSEQIFDGIGIESGGQYFFVPLAIMLYNEVANITLPNGTRSVVSYCPLTDTAVHFVNDAPERFPYWEPAGLLRSNLSMGFCQTCPQASVANQMLAAYINGPREGQCLQLLPSVLSTWNEWSRRHPDTLVLNGDFALNEVWRARWERSSNPYGSYWRDSSIRADTCLELPADTDPIFLKERVFGLIGEGEPVAYLLTEGNQGRNFLYDDVVGGRPVLIVHVNSAAIALERRLPGGPVLGFEFSTATWNDRILLKDDQAEPSLWTLEGIAVAGPLKGQRLAWMPGMSAFWFAWRAVYPTTRIVDPISAP